MQVLAACPLRFGGAQRLTMERIVANRRSLILIVTAAIIGAAAGGYYFGAMPSRNAMRSVEAAQDLLVPVDDMRRTRIRREAIRRTLVEIVVQQESAFAGSKRYLDRDSLSYDHDAFVLEAYETTYCSYRPDDRCLMEGHWLAVARHAASPIGEICAVALNVEPAYIGGIRLKRQGRIRCSWDLATRLNRLLP
jgi:hypothetical protein